MRLHLEVENGLLYTSSTIAQALAGTIALISAFVLYRLQAIKSHWREDTLVAVQAFQNNTPKYDTLMRYGLSFKSLEVIAQERH